MNKKPKIICYGAKARHGKDTTAELTFQELQRRGERVVIIHYADLLKFLCKTYFGWDGNKDEQGRTILQHVGTEIVREQCPDYWVDFVIDLVDLFSDEWDYVLIADARFPNEVFKWREKGYESSYVRIRRDDFISPLTEEQQNHSSETALDNIPYDFLILNNGTIEDLKVKVAELCNNI